MLVLSRFHLCYYCCVRDSYITLYYIPRLLYCVNDWTYIGIVKRRKLLVFITLHIIQLRKFVSTIQFNYKPIVKPFQNNLT